MRPLPFLLCLACAAPAPSADEPDAAKVVRRLACMGTGLGLEVWAVDRPTALRASEAAVRALEATEARLSTWTDQSELARLNEAPVDTWFELSPTLSAELHRARELWEATDRAFDPGIGALVAAWDLRGPGRVPTSAEQDVAVSGSGLHLLSLEGTRAARHHPHLQLEEGGFGKGAGLDRALKELRRAGATRAILDLGGQLALFGQGHFEVAVAHPHDRSREVLSMLVEAGSVATSSNSERARQVGDVLVGHLLDPRTGEPGPGTGSVTVWTRSALDADALATGLFVLGAEAALQYAAIHPGVEVLVIEPRPGDLLTARMSAGLVGRISVPDQAIEWVLIASTAPTSSECSPSPLSPPCSSCSPSSRMTTTD